WRKSDDPTQRPRRVGLRPRDARHGRQRGSACCQMQKISAGKFHSALPEYGRRSAFRHHSALMLAVLITLPHFSVSAAMKFAKSPGEPGRTMPPSSVSRALKGGSARLALISTLSLSTITAGVFFGAPTPNHWLASKPGTKSLRVGRSGNISERLAVVTASARSLSTLIYSIDAGSWPK